uniref:CUB domain-containing protein n=1 Tax=Labrus bergylta TaxID=56723 RepID=A0A3Q3GBV4_9LABR
MDTECTYDYLFVYDGDSYQSPLQASLSGNTLPQPIEAKSGKMLLHLFSDANYNLLGFNATYTFSLCPGACGGHGRCDPSTLKCHCHQGWGGTACTTPLCSQACSVNGQCDKVRLGEGKGQISLEKQTVNIRSYGHSPVSDTHTYTPFFPLNIKVLMFNHCCPLLFSQVARHSHSAVEWTGNMVIFGGELANGSLASDVWMYRPLHDDWQQLGFSNSLGAPKLANHAAAVVDSYLYVFGGGGLSFVFCTFIN